MALTSKEQNKLTKQIKELLSENKRLTTVEANLEKSKEANRELMQENKEIKAELEKIKLEVASLRKTLFLEKEKKGKKTSEATTSFKNDKERVIYLLNKELEHKKVLLLSGKEAVNHTILKYYPTIDKIITAGQRNFKPEVIKSLDLLIIITDYVGHSETGKAETIAGKNNVPVIKLAKISLTSLTEKLCALYKIK